eukprot:1160231-Pelagomonas_calceolata.AAC.5
MLFCVDTPCLQQYTAMCGCTLSAAIAALSGSPPLQKEGQLVSSISGGSVPSHKYCMHGDEPLPVSLLWAGPCGGALALGLLQLSAALRVLLLPSPVHCGTHHHIQRLRLPDSGSSTAVRERGKCLQNSGERCDLDRGGACGATRNVQWPQQARIAMCSEPA